MSNPTRAQVLKIARGEVGTVEKPAGSNKQKYGAAYGMNGVAWCAEFQWWCCFRPFAWTHELKSAYTPDWAAWAKKYGYLKDAKTYKAKAGDLILFQWTTGPARINHIGMVNKDMTEVMSKGGVYTIEGNTGGSDPRNGGMVASVYRSPATCKANIKYFIALPYTEEAEKKEPAKASTASTAKKAAFKSYKVKVTASALNVRKSATSSSSKVKTLKKGDTVTVIGETKGEKVKGKTTWYKIKSGYISAAYTQKV